MTTLSSATTVLEARFLVLADNVSDYTGKNGAKCDAFGWGMTSHWRSRMQGGVFNDETIQLPLGKNHFRLSNYFDCLDSTPLYDPGY